MKKIIPYVKVWQDWTEWLHYKECNWLEFRFINCYLEVDRYCGTFEINLALIGLNLHLSWQYKESNNELQKAIDAVVR